MFPRRKKRAQIHVQIENTGFSNCYEEGVACIELVTKEGERLSFETKWDIREWNPEHSRMSRGITLFEEEAETLTKALARRYGLRLTDREFVHNEPAHRTFITEEPVTEAPEYETAAPRETETAAVPVSEITAACVAESAACMKECAAPATA